MAIVWAAIAFIGVIIIVAIVASLTSPESKNTARLQRLTSPVPQGEASERLGIGDRMPTITAMLSGREISSRLATSLAAAGLRLRPSEFIGIVGFSVVISQIIAVMIARMIFLNLAMAIIGVALPFTILGAMQGRRRAQFDVQLVDALMMIASSLRSGFSFLRGMQVVAQEMPRPISDEFQRVVNEVGVGRTMEEALKNLVARMKSYDLDLVVTAILIQLQVGGNLADMLETIAATIRERMRIHNEMRVLTAEGRLSGWVLVAIPILLGIAIAFINPGYISFLFVEKLGQFLLAGAILLQIIGGLIIKRMLVLDA